MAFEKSQSYKVDSRYQEAKEIPDNNQALNFLQNYLDARRSASKLPITLERRQDDRFIFPAQGGNTDSSIGFRNTFRATPS
jgi:hypothetical protein